LISGSAALQVLEVPEGNTDVDAIRKAIKASWCNLILTMPTFRHFCHFCRC
jgi:hypothetical protein